MSGPTHIARIQFQTKLTSASITRPANTTPYSAGDVVANVTTDANFTFSDAVRPGVLSGSFSSATIVSSANQATKPDMELFLFREDPGTTGDNAAWDVSDAELAECIGVIAFPQASWKVGATTAGAGGNSICVATATGATFKAATTTIYGVLIERATYTPVSGETFTIELTITVD